MPKIRMFDEHAVIHFSKKMEVTVKAPNHDGDPWGPSLGQWGPIGSKKWVKNEKKITMPQNSNGVPLGKKKGQNHKKLPCPKIRIFYWPAVIHFSQWMEFTVMPLKHGGDTLGSILGPMGSHWVQKMGQNVENYHAPKF